MKEPITYSSKNATYYGLSLKMCSEVTRTSLSGKSQGPFWIKSILLLLPVNAILKLSILVFA